MRQGHAVAHCHNSDLSQLLPPTCFSVQFGPPCHARCKHPHVISCSCPGANSRQPLALITSCSISRQQSHPRKRSAGTEWFWSHDSCQGTTRQLSHQVTSSQVASKSTQRHHVFMRCQRQRKMTSLRTIHKGDVEKTFFFFSSLPAKTSKQPLLLPKKNIQITHFLAGRYYKDFYLASKNFYF